LTIDGDPIKKGEHDHFYAYETQPHMTILISNTSVDFNFSSFNFRKEVQFFVLQFRFGFNFFPFCSVSSSW